MQYNKINENGLQMINQQQWYLYGLLGKHMFAMINIGEQNEKANKSKMYRL